MSAVDEIHQLLRDPHLRKVYEASRDSVFARRDAEFIRDSLVHVRELRDQDDARVVSRALTSDEIAYGREFDSAMHVPSLGELPPPVDPLGRALAELDAAFPETA